MAFLPGFKPFHFGPFESVSGTEDILSLFFGSKNCFHSLGPRLKITVQCIDTKHDYAET